MSERPLTDSLSSLLDSTIQRARFTGALTTNLKNANSAHNKTSRALNDYMVQNRMLDGVLLAQSQQALEGMRFKERVSDSLMPDLRREAKALAIQIGALKEAIAALQGEIVDVIKLDHAIQIFQTFQDEDLNALLPELSETLQQAQARLGDEFGAALRETMAEMGIEVRGRPPRFEIGRFEILANFVNRTAAINYGKTMVVPKVKLSLDSVIKAYQQEVKAIEGRNEDGQRWIEQLHQAWELARRKGERNISRVNIVDCYYELVLLRQGRNFNNAPSKRSFVDYSRAQFAYDFDEFTRRQPLTANDLMVKSHIATKSQAESTSKSMWIVTGNSPHDGQYFADIEFVRE